ncbi:hypothetical protein OSB04_017588 [Centaurea solstitialis]|uniref:Uncharacterized protein n=1 Tax=Centaurea solstitialis TaxID=347529 RepID=A0AA38T362_9ASTR|nr:hypothetical protein OSB04_017588 [Centaurea solstitialis]
MNSSAKSQEQESKMVLKVQAHKKWIGIREKREKEKKRVLRKIQEPEEESSVGGNRGEENPGKPRDLARDLRSRGKVAQVSAPVLKQYVYASDGVMIDMASRNAPMSPALGLLRGARVSVDGVMIDMASRCLEVTSDGAGGGYTAI